VEVASSFSEGLSTRIPFPGRVDYYQCTFSLIRLFRTHMRLLPSWFVCENAYLNSYGAIFLGPDEAREPGVITQRGVPRKSGNPTHLVSQPGHTQHRDSNALRIPRQRYAIAACERDIHAAHTGLAQEGGLGILRAFAGDETH